jgi:hypothetical protein
MEFLIFIPVTLYVHKNRRQQRRDFVGVCLIAKSPACQRFFVQIAVENSLFAFTAISNIN